MYASCVMHRKGGTKLSVPRPSRGGDSMCSNDRCALTTGWWRGRRKTERGGASALVWPPPGVYGLPSLSSRYHHARGLQPAFSFV